MPRQPETLGSIYFLREVGEVGPIKIGFTVDRAKRFKTMQACSPVRLEYIAYFQGEATMELRLHTLFREHRLHGEWFAPCAELLAVVDTHRAALDGAVHRGHRDEAMDIAKKREVESVWESNRLRDERHRRKAPTIERQRPFRSYKARG